MLFSNIDRSIRFYPVRFAHNVPDVLRPDGIYEITLVLAEGNPHGQDSIPHFIFYKPSSQTAIEINNRLILPDLVAYCRTWYDTVAVLPLAQIDLIEELLSWFIDFDEKRKVDVNAFQHNTVLSFDAKLIDPDIAVFLSKLLQQTKLLNQQQIEIENTFKSLISTTTRTNLRKKV